MLADERKSDCRGDDFNYSFVFKHQNKTVDHGSVTECKLKYDLYQRSEEIANRITYKHFKTMKHTMTLLENCSVTRYHCFHLLSTT